jgi:hypothetical protein
MKSNLIFKCIVFMFLLATFACKKDNKIISDKSALLKFSEDTIIFDTVFTSVGTITHTLKIYNTFKQTLNISSITLAGGISSNFRLNIDGAKSIAATDIEIAPNDSLYIFVAATIDPNNGTTPLIVTDSIVFDFNGKKQDVDLVAWGQNAHYIKATTKLNQNIKYSIIAGENENITLLTDKPYVIYGYAVVDSAGCLTIPAGTKLHFHSKSGLWVYRYGCLNVEGTKDNPVIFQGDRLDYMYRDQPNQWDRILLNEHTNTKINYAKILNGFIGIQTDLLFDAGLDDSKLKITNTVIANMNVAGIFAKFFDIEGYNNLIYNTGGPCLALTYGGRYSFRNSTFASFWEYPARKESAIILNNYSGLPQYFPLEKAYFGNCIVMGNQKSEVTIDKCKSCSETFNYEFNHCLIKSDNTLDFISTNFITSIQFDKDATSSSNYVFKDYTKNDYHLIENSAAIGIGSDLNIIEVPNEKTDLDAVQRKSPPSVGCYEY